MKFTPLCLLLVVFSFAPLFSQQQHGVEKPFLHPGVIMQQGDRWVGSDFLGHLSPFIGIEMEVLHSQMQGEPLTIDQNYLESRAAEIFRREGLIPSFRMVNPRMPPLPFLHLLVIVYAIPRNAYLIFCGARLFEEVKVVREKFIPTGDWQAITWETQELIIAQKDKALNQIQELVDEVTMTFVRRYREYNPINLEAPAFPAFPSPHHRQLPQSRSPTQGRPSPQAIPSRKSGGY